MQSWEIDSGSLIRGDIEVPGDKSITHRALLLAALATGPSEIDNVSPALDCVTTQRALVQLGVPCSSQEGRVHVDGSGLRGLSEASQPIDLGNSGTTARLLLGVLAGQPIRTSLTGDDSLSQRPMGRVTKPLRTMGACITGPDDAGHLPIDVEGGTLSAIQHRSPVASAQVKSCLLLAGLFAAGNTSVAEPSQSRDHTERLLQWLGVDITRHSSRVTMGANRSWSGFHLTVPGDLSTAAFLMTAAAVTGGSIGVSKVGINPTRTGFLTILQHMGVKVTVEPEEHDGPEPMGHITVTAGDELRGTDVCGEVLVGAIDELPLVMVLGCLARGVTRLLGAGELRVKETDRVHSMVEGLQRLGARIVVEGDDVEIHGGQRLSGATLNSFGDHRTAMSLAVAALAARGRTQIDHVECADISCPSYVRLLRSLDASIAVEED